MCVLDIKRKIWILYTGLSPKSFISEGSTMYMNDNNSDIYRIFNSSAVDSNGWPTDVTIGTDQTANVAQSFTLKEIDLSDIFSMKTLSQIYVSFENYTQEISIDIYMAINRINGKKRRQNMSTIEIPV